MSEKQDIKDIPEPSPEEVKGEEGVKDAKEVPGDEHIEVSEELDADLEKLLKTNPSEGLTNAQVEERLLTFGRNGTFTNP
jgi:hypothetical protein